MKRRFVVSVDTEEDVWGWRSRDRITCANVLELPRLVRFFSRLHIRPTLFVSYQVLSDPSARSVIAELAAEDAVEIGSHVHPWNTPPYDESLRRTVLHNFPAEVQAAKIASVRRRTEDLIDSHPTSFRAGRFGFGPETAACLIDQGYTADSSVTPFFDWTASSRGQNYVGAPLEIYRISPESGVLQGDPHGRLVEVPLTSGYTRLRPNQWQAATEFLRHPAVRTSRIGGIAALALAFRKVILSPESHTVGDMLRLSRAVALSGVGHLQLFLHSSSLVPGLTPFTHTSGDVERLYDRIEEVLDHLHAWFDLDFASVRETAEASVPEPAVEVLEETTPVSVASRDPVQPDSFEERWREALHRTYPRGTRARLAHMARHIYWRMGGYRRFQRVRWSDVRRLVFVCTGNICRSPYAERLARIQGLEAVSIGVNTGMVGVADPMALHVARDRGVRMDDHRTTPLGNFEPRDGDLFIAMEPFQAALVAKRKWPIPHQVTLLGAWVRSNGPVILDPYGGDEERFNRCFSVIERGVARIGRRLEVEASPARRRRTIPSSHAAS